MEPLTTPPRFNLMLAMSCFAASTLAGCLDEKPDYAEVTRNAYQLRGEMQRPNGSWEPIETALMLIPHETNPSQLTLALVVSGVAGRGDVAVGINWDRHSQVAREAYGYELTTTAEGNRARVELPTSELVVQGELSDDCATAAASCGSSNQSYICAHAGAANIAMAIGSYENTVPVQFALMIDEVLAVKHNDCD